MPQKRPFPRICIALGLPDPARLLEGYRKRPGRQSWDGEHVGKWLHAATLAWALEIAHASLALATFHLPHGPAHAMGVLFGVNLFLALPAPPANLGNFEVGAGVSMVALGGNAEAAAAFALGFHALQLLPTLLTGAIFLPIAGKGRAPPPTAASPSRAA